MLCRRRQFRVLRWTCLLAAWGWFAVSLAAAQEGGPTIPGSHPPVPGTFQLTGVGSCAAAGCHGGDGSKKKPDGTFDFSNSAYSVWIQRDPHARAYDVLLTDRSRNMVRQLGPGCARNRAAAHGRPAGARSAGQWQCASSPLVLA